ncbi:MAG: ABC transporter permease [Helicobacteraceae bacterium 4484_230]|nr:MAG: ABC transporter permease [Helicobacteraceae bacterium 4484_230]
MGPLVYTASPYVLDKELILSSPSLLHLMGTDRLGRDLLARVIAGGQVSLMIGVGSALIASFIGLLLGATAGYMRGRVDRSFVVLVDLFESFAITSQPFIKILNIAKVSKWKILLKYYAPLLAPIFFVSFTFGVGGAILAESGLSFLGLGIVAPQMSWGTILSNGKEVIDIAWWVSFFPGLMIFLVTFSLMNIANYLQQLTNKRQVQSP